MSERRPSLIVISAPSGTGKSTVLTRILREVAGLRFSVSHTTRAPRPGERDGVQYHFVGREVFEGMIRDEKLLEWADVHGQLYGTAKAEYDAACAVGHDLVLDIDVQGAAQVRARFVAAVCIFILPPSFQDLEKRLRGRGHDSEEAVARRLRNAQREISHYSDYDYVVVNEDVETCINAVKSIIQSARCRTSQLDAMARRVLATFES